MKQQIFFKDAFTFGALLACIILLANANTPNALAEVLLLHRSTCACLLLFTSYALTWKDCTPTLLAASWVTENEKSR